MVSLLELIQQTSEKSSMKISKMFEVWSMSGSPLLKAYDQLEKKLSVEGHSEINTFVLKSLLSSIRSTHLQIFLNLCSIYEIDVERPWTSYSTIKKAIEEEVSARLSLEYLDEIKSLKTNLSSRDLELSKLRKDLSTLYDEIERVRMQSQLNHDLHEYSIWKFILYKVWSH